MKKIILWALRLIPAIIMLQTVVLYKIPAHPESIALFETLSQKALSGAVDESVFRWSTAILEIIASIMLIISAWARQGALLTIGVMLGAIVSHILFLGYDQVFVMAIIVFLSAVLYLFLSKKLYA